jgi:hypothetical protein
MSTAVTSSWMLARPSLLMTTAGLCAARHPGAARRSAWGWALVTWRPNCASTREVIPGPTQSSAFAVASKDRPGIVACVILG